MMKYILAPVALDAVLSSAVGLLFIVGDIRFFL